MQSKQEQIQALKKFRELDEGLSRFHVQILWKLKKNKNIILRRDPPLCALYQFTLYSLFI